MTGSSLPYDQPIRSADALAMGLTRHGLAHRHWRRMHRGVRVWHDAPIDDWLRIRSAALVLPPGAAIAGHSAATLYGVDVEAPDAPTEVVLPRNTAMRPRRGLLIRRAELHRTDLAEVRGIPVTSPVRTAFDLLRLEPLVEAVAGADALVHAALVTQSELAAYVADHPRWRGVRVAAHALGYLDGRAESPMESRLRMILVQGGLPRPVVNQSLHGPSGTFLGRPDLRIEHVLIEFDGTVHRKPEVFVRDLQRQNRLVEAGFTVLRYTGFDVYRRPSAILAEVRSALAAAHPRRS